MNANSNTLYVTEGKRERYKEKGKKDDHQEIIIDLHTNLAVRTKLYRLPFFVMYHIHTKFRVKSNSITTNYAQTNDGHGISYRDYNNNNSKNHPHTMHNTTTFCGRQCVQGEGDYTFCNIL